MKISFSIIILAVPVALMASPFLVMSRAMASAESPSNSNDAPYLVVLGVAQDGGCPHAGCTRSCCEEARSDPEKRHMVACLAIVDPQTRQRWLIDATPDFSAQLSRLDSLAPPAAEARPPALDGIFLTHAHIGHYTGLMHLGREVMGAQGVPVYAMPRMREFLSRNGPWDQLVRLQNISIRALEADVPIQLNERLSITPLLVPHRDEYTETVGFQIAGPGRTAIYIPDIDKWDKWDRRLEDVLARVDVAFLDGTFYADGEIPGRSMAEIPHPFIVETMQRLAPMPPEQRARIRFIHLNHTNPALNPQSDAANHIAQQGFNTAREGDRIPLDADQLATTRPAATRPAGDDNPPADGFDLEGSDARAIELANQTMRAMGGRRAWDATRYITWQFLGRRTNYWDKRTGNIRLELGDPGAESHHVILMNNNTGKGRAWRGGQEVTDTNDLRVYMDQGLTAWQNDSYWLFMPYKLKDSGVTLKYLGPRKMTDGRDAEAVQVTFRHAEGKTADRYEVCIANDTHLVSQWTYFEGADDPRPKFTQPWSDWQRFGPIMLSLERGPGRRHSNVQVFDELPESVFTNPDPVNVAARPDSAMPKSNATMNKK